MSDSPNPEQYSQSILKNNSVGGSLTTGDISETINYQIFNLSIKDRTELPPITWREVCRLMLEKHPLRQHATEEDFELDIYVPLGLMERKQQQHRPANKDLPMEDVYKLEAKEEITRQFKHNQFLEHIGLSAKQAESTKSIAIIGEPGAGKSTLLEKIAKEIDEQNKGLPICISLANLEGLTIEEYLEQKWLKDALLIIKELVPQAELSVRNVPEELKEALAEKFTNTQQGEIWLLLDGLDEMKATSPVEALTTIEKQIGSGYLAKARVVLSCRLNVWDANLTNPLSKFDIYRTLEFEDSQRDEFIQHWFNQLNKPELGTDLIAKLNESGKERIRELVKNPLRLVLLCHIWTLQQGQLPETKAEFYQRYLPYFYNWKKNIRDLTRQSEKRTELHQALGKLAIAAIDSGSRYRLKDSLACQEMGEELFKLAEALGWLNIVDRDLATNEAVYAFFHPTFQEYFAACAIDDWDFFLPSDRVKKPVKGKEYRIFEPKWKEVILLWLGLGREYVAKEKKEEFINSLVDFEDGCYKFRFLFFRYRSRKFYHYRAYFLAAAGINEFKEYSKTKEIVRQVVELALGNLISDLKSSAQTILTETNRIEAIAALIKLIDSSNDEYTRRLAAKSLGEIAPGNEIAIEALVNLIGSFTDEYTRWLAAESLGKIDPGNEFAIEALVKLIDFSNDEYILGRAADSLEEIAPGNKIAIEALVKLINSSNDESTRWQALYSLGKIAPGNKIAIEALVNLIASTRNESTRWQAVYSLGKIAPGNKIAIEALVNLIASTRNESIRWRAAKSLGEIAPGNEIAIEALVNLIGSFTDEYTRWLAAESLGKIDPGNEIAIAALVKLIDSTSDESIRRQAAESLGKIDQVNEIAIAALVKLIDSSNDESTRIEAAYRLGKIDPGNEIAIEALVKLIGSTRNESTRIEAAYRLGKIDPGNEIAIAALINLIGSTRNESTRIEAAEGLGKIDPGNEIAIAALVNLIDSTRTEFTREQAVESLGKIAPGNEFAIAALVKLIGSTRNESTRWRAAESLEKISTKSLMSIVVKALKNTTNQEAVKVLWECAQNRSYPEFYLAWHDLN
ncbi:MAG: HEAT repeat domain-containing protein [Xenococcaceae cyanobacterium]